MGTFPLYAEYTGVSTMYNARKISKWNHCAGLTALLSCHQDTVLQLNENFYQVEEKEEIRNGSGLWSFRTKWLC